MLRIIAKVFFFLTGWKADPPSGDLLPADVHRCVMIAAPHTSNWDIIYARLAFAILRVPVKFTIKREWTDSPIGWFIKMMGAIGIDRSPKQPGEKRKSMTEAMADLFKTHDHLVVLVTPEGTRKLRTKWKSGFYHVAKLGGVPVALGYLNYRDKIAGIGRELIYPGDDYMADLKRIQLFYKDIPPKTPSKFSPDLEALAYNNPEGTAPVS